MRDQTFCWQPWNAPFKTNSLFTPLECPHQKGKLCWQPWYSLFMNKLSFTPLGGHDHQLKLCFALEIPLLKNAPLIKRDYWRPWDVPLYPKRLALLTPLSSGGFVMFRTFFNSGSWWSWGKRWRGRGGEGEGREEGGRDGRGGGRKGSN